MDIMQNMCLTCSKKNDTTTENQLMLLIRKLKDDISKNIQSPKQVVDRSGTYVWNNTLRCKYGMSYCMYANRGHIQMLEHEAELLMDRYISETNCKNYKEIASYMQGFFPQIYSEFVRRVVIKKEKGENI